MESHAGLIDLAEMFVVTKSVMPMARFRITNRVPPVWVRIKVKPVTAFAREIEVANDDMMRITDHVNRNAVHKHPTTTRRVRKVASKNVQALIVGRPALEDCTVSPVNVADVQVVELVGEALRVDDGQSCTV